MVKKPKRTLFIKYFSDFFIIILLCLSIIIFLITYGIFNFANTQNNIYITKLEGQTKQLISSVSDECTKLFAIISSNNTITTLEQPNIQNLPDSKLYDLSNPLSEQISNHLINNDYISSVFIYSFKNDIVLSNSGLNMTHDYSNYIWYYNNLKLDSLKKVYWVSVLSNPYTGAEYIAIYKSLDTNNTQRGIVVIMINTSNLTNSLRKILQNSNCSFLLWNNHQNTPLINLCDDDADLYQIWQNSLNSSKKAVFNNKYSYTSYPIMEYNWNCIFVYDNAYTLKKICSIIIPIIPFTLIIFIIMAVIISYIRAKKTYRPINHIVSVLNSLQISTSNEVYINDYKYSEIKYIMDIITSTIHDKNKIQTELEIKVNQLNNAKQYALQAQIQPHFIFNTLEIIYLEAYKLLGSDNIVSEMICSLSDIIRITFRGDGKFISIHNELFLVEKYIHIQSIRFEDKFKTIWDIDHSLDKFPTPKLILQPIIENSIIHGIIPAEKPCTLTIKSRCENNSIIFTIEDTGIGMTKERLTQIRTALQIQDELSNNNIGIINVHMRIQIMFGKDYGCRILSSDNTGTKIEIVIPKICEEFN